MYDGDAAFLSTCFTNMLSYENRQAKGRLAYVFLLLLSFFFIFFHLFNDRLEQRDLRTYQTDIHQIFRVDRHVAVDVRCGICFAIAQGTILGAQSTEIGDTPTFLGLTFHNE